MSRDFPDRPIAGVGAVIVHQGRVVIVQRANEPRKGEWSIPGGVLEIGETLRQCAAREAREETGLEVEPGEVLDVFDSITTEPDGRARYHFVIVDFLCRLLGGELRAGGDAMQARWISAEELENFVMSDNTKQVIRKGLGAEACLGG
jgi:ADP-ribose pyrophosphatase YjhB (NUDIX family)